ncbi:hypothetical protein JM654_23575 [Microbacterium oxydans]|nr:hypothetical protein [Microbacterium oxydans]
MSSLVRLIAIHAVSEFVWALGTAQHGLDARRSVGERLHSNCIHPNGRRQ